MVFTPPGVLGQLAPPTNNIHQDPRLVGRGSFSQHPARGYLPLPQGTPSTYQQPPGPHLGGPQAQPAPLPAAPLPAAPLPAATADPDNEWLFGQIGRNKEADLALMLAVGGFSMAEAAGQPGGPTFLSSLGTGGKAGISAVVSARAAAAKADTASAQLNIDRTVAQARLATAINSSDTTMIRNVMAMGLTPGTKEFQKEMRKQLADPSKSDAFMLYMEAKGIEPGSQEWLDEWDKRGAKLTHISNNDPLVEAIRAMASGAEKQQDIFGKFRGEARGDEFNFATQAFKSLPRLNDLEKALMSTTVEPGKGAVTIESFLTGINSIASRFGWDLPESLSPNKSLLQARAIMNDFVSQMLKNRMGARPSDKDLEFLIQVLPNMGLDRDTNIALIKDFRETLLVDIRTSMDYFAARVTWQGATEEDRYDYNRLKDNYAKHMNILAKRYQADQRTPMSDDVRAMLLEFIDQGIPVSSG